MLRFPLDFTFGVGPNAVPHTDLLWLLLLFAAEYAATLHAVKHFQTAPRQRSPAFTWLTVFVYLQTALAVVAVTCHLTRFTVFDRINTLPEWMLIWFNAICSGVGGFMMCYYAPVKGRHDGDEFLEATTRTNAETPWPGARRGTSSASTSLGRVVRSAPTSPNSPTGAATWKSSCALTTTQWRLLSVLVIVVFIGLLLNSDISLFVQISLSTFVVLLVAAFLISATVLCRGPWAEQSAEFAVAAAGVLISNTPTKIWGAAPIVGNVVVLAAALHMAVSLTVGMPRLEVSCAPEEAQELSVV